MRHARFQLNSGISSLKGNIHLWYLYRNLTLILQYIVHFVAQL